MSAHASDCHAVKKDSSIRQAVNSDVTDILKKHFSSAAANFCGQINWATWNTFTSNTAAGRIDNNGPIVNVGMSADYPIGSTPGIYHVDKFSGFSQPVPDGTVPSTTWGPAGTSRNTTSFCFDFQQTNPVLLLSSLGASDGTAVKLTFSRPYIVLYDGGGMTFNDSHSLTGIEGYALIMFPGDMSCVDVSANNHENYTNISLGLFPPPYPVTISQTASNCTSVTLKANMLDGVTYHWNGGDTPDQPTNTFHTSGIYEVTATNSSGCTTANAKTITVGENTQTPVINIVSSTCGSVILKASAGGASYLWDGGDSPGSATNTFHTSGTYNVIITYPDHCQLPVSKQITVDVPPVTTITESGNICGGVTLTASPGGTSYHWNGGDTPDQPTNTFHTSGTYQVTVTYPDNSCPSVASRRVTVVGRQESPEINIVSSTCGSVTVKASDGGTIYQWNGNGDTPNSATNTYHVSGVYSVLVTYPEGCSTPAFKQIDVVVPPVTTITQTADVCGTVTLTASGSGAIAYHWDDGDTPDQATNTFHASGTYHVTVSYSNTCSVTLAKSVIVRNALPTNISVISNGCGTAILKASDGGATYRWDGGDTPDQAINAFHTSGTYTVMVTYPNSCPSSKSIDVIVNQPPVTSISEVNNVCGTVTLKASDGGLSYQWDGGDTPDQATNAFHTSGTYHLVVTYPDQCRVPVQKDVLVNQSATASVEISTPSTKVCDGTAVLFTARISPGTADQSIVWLKNGQPTGVTTPSYSPATIANGDQISCQLTSTNVCTTPGTTGSNVLTMQVAQRPVIDLPAEITISAGHSVMLQPVITGNILSASWTPTTGVDFPSSENPTVSPETTTIYTLNLQSVDGCPTSASVKVIVTNVIVTAPNTFTPNGDNVNDLWNITNIDSYPNCTVNIFNRYGTKVFYSKGYSKPWDGSYSNQPVPAGVYYYVIDLNDKNKTHLTGYVTVIR